MRGQLRAILLIVSGALALTFILESVRPTQAMPPFAQAYGMRCEVCHSSVPALNAYGRYVQNTGLASLDPGTLHQVNPFWIGVSPVYDTSMYPTQTQTGNFAIHAVGFIGDDITFHLHQWVVKGDQWGGTDTMWIGYNNLLHRDGHFFVGKIQEPAPGPFFNWPDMTPFAPPEMTVGEHTYELDAARWGTKLSYAHKGLFADAGYVGTNGNLNTAFDFSTPTDKSFQYRVAYATADKPIEAGVYGSLGSWPISDGTFDRYTATAAYVQTDSEHGIPAFFGLYQWNSDPNPGPGLPSTSSKGFSTELTEPIGPRITLAGRYQMTDDGLGTLTHFGNVTCNWLAVRNVTPKNANSLIVTGQESMVTGSTPTWQVQLWFVTTLGGRL